MGMIGRGWFDTFVSFVSGLGTAKDKTTSAQYVLRVLTRMDVENAFRGDWIARKIVCIPAQDATREWRAWQADKAIIESLETVERKLRIQQKVRWAKTLARLYGGAGLILGVEQGSPDKPLKLERVKKDQLKFVHAVSMHDLTAGPPIRDLFSEWYGEPEYYERRAGPDGQDNLRLHPSRVVRFLGDERPDPQNAVDTWGDSVLQVVDDAVRGAGLMFGSMTALVQEMKYDIIGIPGLNEIVTTNEGRDKLTQRFMYANTAKSIVNTLVRDAEETWEQRQVSFTGMPEILQQYLVLASGAADIPAVRMLSQSPAGLNATGESDIRNHYDRISSEQNNDLTPTMERLDEVLIRSATGARDEAIHFIWNPLWQMSDAEKADVAKKKAETFKIDADLAMIPDVVLGEVRVNQLIEDSTYPGLDEAMEEFDFEAFLGTPEEQVENEEAQLQLENKVLETKALPPPAKVPVRDDWQRALLRSVKDASAARTLYVRRDVLNADALKAWFSKQGMKTMLPAHDMHVTIAFSRAMLDWTKIDATPWGEDDKGRMRIRPGGMRVIETFGQGATVLLFNSTELNYRHEAFTRAGASWDWPDYTPHITLSYEYAGDIDDLEPYTGEIILGPEIWQEIKEDWKARVVEDFDPEQPRDPYGRWTEHGASEFAVDWQTDMTVPEDQDAREAQPTNDLDELYTLARNEEQGFLRELRGFAHMTAGDVMVTPPEFAEPGTILKSRASAERKLKTEWTNRPDQLRDILRGTVVHDTVVESRKAAARFRERMGERVITMRDRFANPLGGYRDILVNYRTKGGMIAELQFNTKALIDAKLGEGHRIYEKLRNPDIRGQYPNLVLMMERRQASIYEAAYKAGGNGAWRKK